MPKISTLLFPQRRVAVSLFTAILLLAFSRFTIGQNPQANVCHMDSSGFCITEEIPSPPNSVPTPRTNLPVAPAILPQDKSTVTARPTELPKLEVEFHNGLLRIVAQNVSLKETLKAVSASTGAEIQCPVGALDDHVFVHLGPGTPQEVVPQLLKGSHLNYVMLSSTSEPGGMTRLIITRTTPDTNSDSSATLTSTSDGSTTTEIYGTFAIDADNASEGQATLQPATPTPNWVHHDGAVLSGEQLDQMQKAQIQQEQQQFAQQLQLERQRQQEQAGKQQ
jgi:hypothetical protein